MVGVLRNAWQETHCYCFHDVAFLCVVLRVEAIMCQVHGTGQLIVTMALLRMIGVDCCTVLHRISPHCRILATPPYPSFFLQKNAKRLDEFSGHLYIYRV